MAPTETEIRALLASQTSYSSSSIPQLEDYLQAQCTGSAPYLFDAVRTLIKLYHMIPDQSNPGNIGRAYMLALLQFPNYTDLLALSYMISQTVLSQEPCATIQKCFDQLNDCQFAQFWETFESLKSCQDEAVQNMAKQSNGRFQDAICQVLALTYKQAPTDVVLKALNVSSIQDVSGFSSVESANESQVVFVSTVDNTKRRRVYQEGVNFATISSLLDKIAQ